MSPQMGVVTDADLAAAVAAEALLRAAADLAEAAARLAADLAHAALTVTHGTVDDVADQTDIAAHAADFDAHAVRGVVKTADETVNNSVALQDDDELFFAIGANEVWEFALYAWCISTAVADIKVNFTVPAGATYYFTREGDGVVGAPQNDRQIGGSGANAWGPPVRGVVINGAAPGNLQLQWAQVNLEVSDAIMRAHSVLVGYRVV